MPRQARESSGTGIYHVMMRGINHQSNHIHLLIREREDKIGMAIKSIHQKPVKAGMVAEVKDGSETY